MATLTQYEHVCILFGHMEPDIAEFKVRVINYIVTRSFLIASSRLCTQK